MKYWTMKDDYGSLYMDEFWTYHKEDIDDNMCANALMDLPTLDAFLKDGFKIVRVEIKELEDE